MWHKIKELTIIHLFFLAIFCFLPAMSWAAVAIKTEVISGNLVQNNTDHSVRLDDGNLYFPSREGLIIDVQIGKPVTLRYIVETGNKKVFFEYAPGLNSLTEIALPAPRK